MSDWWSKRLGGEPAPRQQQGTPVVPQAVPPEQRPMAPVPQQYAPPSQDVQQPYVEGDPNAEVNIGDMLRTKQYTSVPPQAKALNAHGGTCPDCGSGNFYKDARHQHCHDCGYPIVQAGSGMGALGGTGIVTSGPTHQAQSPTYTQQL